MVDAVVDAEPYDDSGEDVLSKPPASNRKGTVDKRFTNAVRAKPLGSPTAAAAGAAAGSGGGVNTSPVRGGRPGSPLSVRSGMSSPSSASSGDEFMGTNAGRSARTRGGG